MPIILKDPRCCEGLFLWHKNAPKQIQLHSGACFFFYYQGFTVPTISLMLFMPLSSQNLCKPSTILTGA